MPDRITTRGAAIEEMLRWANGEETYRHELLMRTTAQELTPSEWALCALADTAEVQKWAAVAGALKDAPLDVEWPDDDRTVVVDRDLLERCLSTVELEWGRTETVLRLEAALGKTT